MFERAVDRAAVVADLRRRMGAVGGSARDSAAIGRYDASREHDSPLATPDPLAAVLPGGGLPRGSVVSLGSTAPGGGGVSSLLLALLAAPEGAWCAAVGFPDLGLLAAAELGVDLGRLGLVPDPGGDLLQVISALVTGVDIIATVSPLELPTGLTPGRQRVITGRLREGGAVLLVTGPWPGADLVLTVTGVRWTGLGHGHGRLTDRELDVVVAGRRAGSGMGAEVTLALRAGRDEVSVEPGRRHTWIDIAGDGRDFAAG